MSGSPDLHLPVKQGAAIVALSYLADAADASRRLGAAVEGAAEPEALHDFRVGVRRLRSWIRAFRAELDGVGKRDLKRLRKIARATNAGRDADVQLAWLTQAARGGGERRRAGARWMTTMLERRRSDADERMGDILGRRFSKLHAALESALSGEMSDREPERAKTLAEAIAERMAPAAEALRGSLASVHTVADEQAAHEARIAAKRLRYLIEPAVARVDGGEALLGRLKALQDDLGLLHDRQVMARELVSLAEWSAAARARLETAASLGDFGATVAGDDAESLPEPRALVALARHLGRDLDRGFATVADAWLEDGGSLDGPIAAFADGLRSGSPG